MKNFLKRLASAFGGGVADTAQRRALPPDPPGSAFEPQNELERMLVIASGDAGQRPAFERMLMDGDLFAATPDAPQDGGDWRTLEEGETVSLYNVTAPDGSTVPAVFTSERRLAEAFGTGAGFIRMKGSVLLEMAAAQGAFLNPGAAYGVHWTAQDLAALMGRPVPRTIEQDTRILLGAPAEPPEALIAALRARFAGEPGVSEAWLALAQWPEPSGQSWYLDVRTDLPHETVQELLAGLFAGPDLRGMPLDLVIHPPGEGEGTGIRVAPAGLN